MSKPKSNDQKLERNPLLGDENFHICVQRQVNRKVPEALANDICINLSAALGTNALKEASDMVIVPAVFTQEGVHNGRYKPWKAISDAAPTLVGVPFFIFQPDEHDDGVVPPVDDPMRHHGLVLTVNKDEPNKRLTGLIGLFKPDYLQKKGFTAARVNFQKTLIDSLDKGGRFAISVSFLARLARKPGIFANKAYGIVEEKVVFNGVSIVPAGAEPAALMNGLTGESDVDVLANGFNADLDPETAAESANRIELLNTAYKQSGPTAMDADTLRSLSLTRLSEMNQEVARLVNKHESLTGDLAAANKRVADEEKVRKTLESDAEKTAELLANLLDEEKADQIIANAESNVALALQVKEKHSALVNKLREQEAKDNKALEDRIKAARKALANRFKPDDLKDFEDPKDLAATANRLEKLATTLATRRVQPAEDVVAGINADLESDEDLDHEDEEAISNGEATAEYEQLVNLYTPEARPAKTAPKTRRDA